MKQKAIPALIAILLGAIQAQAATLQVDQEKSRIQVDAHATGHEFTGTLGKYTAKVSGDSSSLNPAGFDLNWSFKDLDTADKKRDAEMLKWLGGGDPKGKFRFTKSWVDKKGVNYAMGELTIKGASKTISFPYTVKNEGGWVIIDGKAGMDYKDFGLPIIRAMVVMTVDPKLSVRFHIVGKIK
jgi:polyisoprenoid-binding protein YceI